MKKYTELWYKIKDLIKSATNTSGDYEKKYMKIKFNSDGDLPLNKTLKFYNSTSMVGYVFQEDKRYYPQVFLDECLYKLQML